ncbi:MAG: DUF4382 domain-containing protein [Ferruginibacter sp.]
MKKYLLAFFIFSIATSLFLISCSKDDVNGGTSTLNLRLTDGPTALDSVFVDIREVRVKMQDDSTENNWINMTTNAGIYNLLQLQNGIDTLLATTTLPTGIVREIRFILGTQNRVVASGISYPLTIPSGAESGLKIKVSKKLNATLETLIIDFDAALSIRQENNGYKLRPVLRVK